MEFILTYIYARRTRSVFGGRVLNLVKQGKKRQQLRGIKKGVIEKK